MFYSNKMTKNEMWKKYKQVQIGIDNTLSWYWRQMLLDKETYMLLCLHCGICPFLWCISGHILHTFTCNNFRVLTC